MAAAIAEDRPHRASGALALHVLEIMAGLVAAAEGAGVVAIESRCQRPRPLAAGLTRGEIA